MASKDRPPRPEDNGWLRGGEMDYDQMLAHYQVQEPEEPHEEPYSEGRESHPSTSFA